MPTMVLSWIKRSQSRSGSWSHKRVTELLGRHGYTVGLGYPGNPDATMIASTTVTGSEDDLIQHRRAITNLLRTFSRNIDIKIDVTNRSDE